MTHSETIWKQASPENYMEREGPLDCRKYNENNKGSQIGQVAPKKNI